MSEFYGSIGHLEGLESPFGNAGGVVKTVEDVERMAHTGVGWIEAGSYTLEKRIGNSPNGETVYYHNSETGETFNSLGMPNNGMDIVETEIPEMAKIAHAHKKPLIVNVAPVSSDPVGESYELVSRAYQAGADAVLLNAGCPNVVTGDGGRHEILSHQPKVLGSVLLGLEPVRIKFKPVFVRLSPVPNPDSMDALADALALNPNSAVFTPNTWGGNRPVDRKGNEILEVPGGVGGKSGPAMAEEALLQANITSILLRSLNIDVVLSSGIMKAETLQRGLDTGISAGAGTTFFYESENGWKEDVDRMLNDLAA